MAVFSFSNVCRYPDKIIITFVWPQKIFLLKSDIATAPLLFPSQSIDDDTELLNVELRRQILNYSFVGWIILGVGYLFCC